MLREKLEELEILCWNATEKDVDDKVEKYLKSYPHLRNPATIDLLREAVKTWFKLRDLEKMRGEVTTIKDKLELENLINKTTRMWLQMIGNLGVTFTRIQYKSQKKTVMPPLERLKMLERKGKQRDNVE